MRNIRLPALVLLVAAAAATGRVATAELMDGVAAIVNDRVITFSEVRDYVRPVVVQLRRDYQGQDLMEKLRTAQLDALNNLIERALIVHEYQNKGYSLPDNVVDLQLEDIIATDFSGDRTTFIKTLQAEGLTLAQYRDRLRERIIVQAMRNRKVGREVVVSPYKIETYYADHQEDYRIPDRVKLRMIFVKKTPAVDTPAADTAASTNAPAAADTVVDPRRQLAEQLLQRLDQGEGFETLARQFSDAREAERGGDWGWIARDVLAQSLSEAAFALRAGQHSPLVETDDGYYLLYVEDFQAAHVPPLSEVRAEIEDRLLRERRSELQKEWIKDLRSRAYIRMF
ncbi:peptidylprolyl isomerase [bacterium]|nr:peptidylprolyl isomerase [bacterium]